MALTDADKLAMELGANVDFTESLKRIDDLQKHLSCQSCKKFQQNLISLWCCDHVFCKDCIDDKDMCPICSVPALKEDHMENLTVNQVATQAAALKDLLEAYMALPKDQFTTLESIMNPENAETVPSVVKLPATGITEEPLKTKLSASEETDKINEASSADESVLSFIEIDESLSNPKKIQSPEASTSMSRQIPRKSKFKITPAKPFPDITDSEDTQLSSSFMDTNQEPTSSEMFTGIKKRGRGRPKKKIANEDVITLPKHTFATPSPPKTKRLSAQQSTLTPKATTSRVLAQSVTKTPKSAKKNRKGETLLHIAAIKGNVDDVKRLIEDGQDLNMKDNAGWTPLHEACNHGNVEIVAALLEAGALINVPGYDNETPLMDACRQGNQDVVRLLLDKGADISLRSTYGLTASDVTIDKTIKTMLEEHQLLTQASMDFDTGSFLNSPPDRITISFSSKVDTAKAQKCAELINATVKSKDAISATHYIIPISDEKKSPRTAKYLQAVSRGIWIVNDEWLDACISAQMWVCENDFEVIGSEQDLIDGGPKRSRINKAAKCPGIFHGCHFYLYGFFKPPSIAKPRISKILELAGGTMLTREPKPHNDIVQTCTKVPYHARNDGSQHFYTYYIVYDDANGKPLRIVRKGKVCTVPLSWVLDCISQFYLCETLELE